MKKSKKSTIETVILLLIIAAVIFACCFMLQKKSKERAQEEAQLAAQKTEVELLLEMDIENGYPKTVRAVLKLYSRIVQCLHNEEITDAQISAMALQLRTLFDEEFLANNPYNEHVDSLILEVAEYDMLDRTIPAYEIDSIKSLEEWENENGKFCSLVACYSIKEAEQYGRIYEKFLFRLSEDNNWKIVGWEKADENDMEAD